MPDNNNNNEQNKTPEYLEREMELNKEILETRRTITESLEGDVTRQEKIKKIREEELGLLDDKANIIQNKITENKKELIDLNKQLKEDLSAAYDLYAEQQEILDNKSDYTEDEVKDAKEQQETLVEEVEELQKKKEHVEAIVSEQEESKEYLETRKELHQDAREAVRETLDTTLGISEAWKSTTSGKMMRAMDRLADGDFNELLEDMGKELKNTMTFSNIAGSTMMKMQEATAAMNFEIDHAAASFTAATGAGEQYRDAINETVTGNLDLYMSAQDVSQGMQALYNEFGMFNKLSQETQEKMAAHVAKLEKIGVNSRVASENMGFLTKGLGQTEEQAMKTQKSLLKTGEAIGMGSRIIEEYQQSLSTLGKYGDQSQEVFEGIAVHARETGVQVQELLGTVEQFDTFEGAAESAGRLNAMLGSDLINSVDMMRKTEAERIETLRNVVDQSGQAWESMNRYRKQSIAAAAGIKDMQKAERLFGNQSQKNIDLMKAKKETQQNLNQTVREATPLMNKMKNAAYSFALSLRPLFKAAHYVVDTIIQWDQAVRSALGGVTGFIGILGGLITTIWAGVKVYQAWTKAKMLWNKIANSSIGTLIKETFLHKSNAEAMEDEAEAQDKANKSRQKGAASAASFAKKALALGAALMMVGAAVMMIGTGISYMAESIAKLEGKQLQTFQNSLIAMSVILFGMAAGIYAVGAAAGVSAIPMLAFGGAVMMVGAGIGMAVAALGYLVGQFSVLADIASGGEIMKLALAVTTLSAASLVMAVAAPAIGMMAASLYTLSYAIAAIPLKQTKALSSLFQNLGGNTVANNISKTANAISKLNPKLSKMVEHIQNMPENKAVALSSTLDSISNMSKSAAQLKQKKADKVIEIIKQTKQLHNNTQGKESKALDKLAEVISSAVGNKGGGKSKGKGNVQKIEIPIILDGRQIEKKIIEVVGNELNLHKKN